MVSIRVCISMYPGVPSATFRLPTPKSCQPPHPHAQMVLLRRLGQALDDAEERQDVGGLENSGSLPSREERRGLLDGLSTSSLRPSTLKHPIVTPPTRGWGATCMAVPHGTSQQARLDMWRPGDRSRL